MYFAYGKVQICFFKNAYADGEYTFEEWKRLKDKYREWQFNN